MPKTNEFMLTGNVESIESRFLEGDGAEVCDIVLTWDEAAQYPGKACVNFYSKKGLAKLNALQIKVGDNITIPCQPSSKLKSGTSAAGNAYRFFQTTLRGDSWRVVVNSGQPSAEEVAF